jgi:predicted nuclease of predicted toxin-antitoxin system
MSLSLLLDENLSEKLLHLLFDRFPNSRHVRLIGLGGADDLAIWDRARLDGDLLVTKDESATPATLQRPSCC